MLKIKYIPLVLLSLTIISCKSGHGPEAGATASTDLVDAKYSLTKDRAEFEKLRESIPVEKQKKNDEQALMLDWMGSLKHPPDVIRNKFSALLKKKRDLFNKDMTRSREAFNNAEKKEREAFLKELEDERSEFNKSRKIDQGERSRFYNDQDKARRNFSADQRDKREDYEADVREKRKNFEDYVREKTDEFNADLKEYSIRWKEKIEKDKQN